MGILSHNAWKIKEIVSSLDREKWETQKCIFLYHETVQKINNLLQNAYFDIHIANQYLTKYLQKEDHWMWIVFNYKENSPLPFCMIKIYP